MPLPILHNFLFGIGVVPDLGETDSGVEPEIDVQWDTQVKDDVPRQDAIETLVERHHHCLANLEECDNPQSEVTHQQECHHSSARLAFHLENENEPTVK